MLNFKVPDSLFLVQYWLVRMIGVEPTWITPPDPKSGASANFATSASVASAPAWGGSTSAKGLQK